MQSVFRPSFGKVLTGAIGVCCAVALIMTAVQDGFGALWRYGPWILLLAGAVWALYWNPRVEINDDGVRIVNIFRTIDIGWQAIVEVHTQWSLTLVTAAGKYTAWAAPAPSAIATMRASRRRSSALNRHPSETFSETYSSETAASQDISLGASGSAAQEILRRREAAAESGGPENAAHAAEVRAVWNAPVIFGGAALLLIALIATQLS